jgi:hypothetical protein
MTRRGGNAHHVADPGNSFGGSYNRLSLEPKRELCPANDLGLTRLVDGKPDLAPEWHSSQDLCSAFVAAVVHVNELAARKRHALAHFHQCLAAWALRRRRFQAGLGFVLRYHHLRHRAWCAGWIRPLQPAWSRSMPSKPAAPALSHRSPFPRACGSAQLAVGTRLQWQGCP